MNSKIKPTYLFIGAAMMFSACSQEDMPVGTEGNGNLIAFRTSLAEVTSRAEVITESNLPYFQITAFDFDEPDSVINGIMRPYFANETVDIDADEQTHTSPQCCWPIPTKESHQLSFYGFYPAVSKVPGAKLVNNSTATALDYKYSGFRVAKDIAEQLDFITAYASGSMAENLFNGIELQFAHQLSRIEIKAHGAHKSCDIEIAGVRIGGAGVEGTFEFKPIAGGGQWTGTPTRGIVEYIYRNGDKIFTCGNSNRVYENNAVSIMGNDSCAMIIPANYTGWDHANDAHNAKQQLYLSVLIRVTDATVNSGQNPVNPQRYPYTDLSQGADALDIPKVYFAVKKNTGVISTRLYKDGDRYCSDAALTAAYTLPADEEIKEFGWAALPIKGNMAPGFIYTYILDYSHGVGLHDPEVTYTSPGAGDAIISDKVGISYTVKEWQVGGGSQFTVPGS